MRMLAAVALAIGMWAVNAAAAQAAPMVTMTGSMGTPVVAASGTFGAAGKVAVRYSCIPREPTDYCGGWFASVAAVPAGQPCHQDAVRWVGTTEDASVTARDYDVSWSEYAAGPRDMTACLYGYADGQHQLLAQVGYKVRAAAPPPAPPGAPAPPADPVTQADCEDAFKVQAAGKQVSVRRKLPVAVFGGAYANALGVTALRLEMKDSATGRVFYSHDFSAREIDDVALADQSERTRFFMRLDRGDGPAFAQLSWTGWGGCQGQARTPDIAPVNGSRGQVKAMGTIGDSFDDATPACASDPAPDVRAPPPRCDR
jgi:hypothetical protein